MDARNLQYYKLINVIHNINKLKDKSHVIISTHAENDFDKIQPPLMIKKKKKKTLQKVGIKGTHLNIIKSHIQQTHRKNILNGGN